MSKPITSIPSANILLSSLRSVGYTPETAIADIVDNSLSANASAITIEFNWQEQVIIISDNGDGMSEQELLKSMNIGSSDPLNSRSIHDLGRFGMGMKTASFSLGKKLTVLAKTSGIINNASWDLDYVKKKRINGRYSLKKDPLCLSNNCHIEFQSMTMELLYAFLTSIRLYHLILLTRRKNSIK